MKVLLVTHRLMGYSRTCQPLAWLPLNNSQVLIRSKRGKRRERASERAKEREEIICGTFGREEEERNVKVTLSRIEIEIAGKAGLLSRETVERGDFLLAACGYLWSRETLSPPLSIFTPLPNQRASLGSAHLHFLSLPRPSVHCAPFPSALRPDLTHGQAVGGSGWAH